MKPGEDPEEKKIPECFESVCRIKVENKLGRVMKSARVSGGTLDSFKFKENENIKWKCRRVGGGQIIKTGGRIIGRGKKLKKGRQVQQVQGWLGFWVKMRTKEKESLRKNRPLRREYTEG